jgi:Rieske Fe-S protein
MTLMDSNEVPLCPSRRRLLAAAGGVGVAGVLAGCTTYGASNNQPAAPPPAAATTSGTDSSSGSGSNAGGAKPPIAKTADVPVGGGKILTDQKIVVTQPQAGTFKAFSAVCTHQGCTVSEIKGGTINCPCHGSKFHVADGSVARGPAAQPLAAVNVAVDGTGIVLA